MTKRELAEQVLAASSGGDNVAPKVTFPEALNYIDMGLAELMGTAYVEQYWKLGEKSVNGNWITTFTHLPVRQDTARKDHYINLPAQLIALEESRGLQVVCKMGDETSAYNIIGPADVDVYMNLECGQYPGQQYCYPEGNKVRLIQMGPVSAGCLHMVKMVTGSKGLEENRVLPVSGQYEAQLFRTVMQLMATEDQTPQKKTNDGNPNTI